MGAGDAARAWARVCPGLSPGVHSPPAPAPRTQLPGPASCEPMVGPGGGGGGGGQHPDSRRLLCSMRRWQYSKAFSRRRSGGSRRPVEEAADSTDRVEPSCSDLSSGERTVVLRRPRPRGHRSSQCPGSATPPGPPWTPSLQRLLPQEARVSCSFAEEKGPRAEPTGPARPLLLWHQRGSAPVACPPGHARSHLCPGRPGPRGR